MWYTESIKNLKGDFLILQQQKKDLQKSKKNRLNLKLRKRKSLLKKKQKNGN